MKKMDKKGAIAELQPLVVALVGVGIEDSVAITDSCTSSSWLPDTCGGGSEQQGHSRP